MICTFFGHKDVPDSIERALKETIKELIERKEVKQFYVGNNGHFDFLVQKVLREVVMPLADVRYSIVLSFINESALSGDQDATEFPEGLEKTPRRFAISKRNEWMISHAIFVIAYVQHTLSHSYQWVEKAKCKGLRIINLADQ